MDLSRPVMQNDLASAKKTSGASTLNKLSIHGQYVSWLRLLTRIAVGDQNPVTIVVVGTLVLDPSPAVSTPAPALE